MTRPISRTISGASPSVGSSISRSSGLVISARPMASICCSPPERVPRGSGPRSRRRGNRLEDAGDGPAASAPAPRHLQVLDHGQRREDAPPLRDERHAPRHDPVRRQPRDVVALEAHGAARAGVKPMFVMRSEGGLAGAVAAEERHDLAPARPSETPCRTWLSP